ncbi:MAG: hypothetical protein QOH05_4877 [Acetobacteraceae bacterium]|nr:hypothetical protein [Acetobacteraceae bacterium]
MSVDNNRIAPPVRSFGPACIHECLIDAAGGVAGEHVLVIGNDMPGIIDALAYRDAAEILLLGPRARPGAHTVDIALVSGIASIDDAKRAVAMIRHALSATGRVAARVCCEPTGGVTGSVMRLLRSQGFSAIHVSDAGDNAISAPSCRCSGRRHIDNHMRRT